MLLYTIIAVITASATGAAGVSTGASGTPAQAPDTPTRAEPARPPQPKHGEAGIAEVKRHGGRFLATGNSASWSPDGSRLVVADGDTLRVLDTTNGKSALLVTPGRAPAWSPVDGRYIAYVRTEGASDAVWLVDTAGGKPRRLAEGSSPTWSSDGKILLLVSMAKSQLQAIRTDVKEPRPVDLPAAPGRFLAVSADGMRAAYHSGKQLVVLERKSRRTLLAWPLADCGGLGAWSPDGRLLAVGRPGPGAAGLWVLEVEKNQAMHLACGPCTAAAWSPDGSKLAIDLRLPAQSEIWMIDMKRLGLLQRIAPAFDRCTTPEAAGELIGLVHRCEGNLVTIDLKRQANRKLAEATGKIPANDLKDLPQGEQTFAGIKVRIEDSIVELASTKRPEGTKSVEGIPVRRRASALYLLHATQWGGRAGVVDDGTVIGWYRLRYKDGSLASLPIVYGEDVRDWWSHDGGQPVTRGQVVWIGRNAPTTERKIYLRLYLTRWENPHPEKSIASIDYSSTMTGAAPFCVAITVEEPVASSMAEPTARANGSP